MAMRARRAAADTLHAALEGRRVLFVGGKGGVGKTTIAGALALAAAERGQRVLLVSTDPAHSLSDLFERAVGDRPRELAPGLHALEIDPDAQVERYLAGVRQNLKSFVRPEMYGEIDRQIELARQAPGATEAALLERVAELMDEGPSAYDRVIFDTAPTGHTLRLLALPEIMLAWTEGLLRSRDRSDSFRGALDRLARGRRKRPDHDEREAAPGGRGKAAGGEGESGAAPVMDDDLAAGDAAEQRSRDDLSWFGTADADSGDARTRRIREILLARRRKFAQARRILLDPEVTAFLLVLVPERLPLLESRTALEVLRRHDVPVAGLVVNRVLPDDASGEFVERRRAQQARYLDRIDQELGDLPRVRVPLLPEDVVGVDGLREVARHLARADD